MILYLENELFKGVITRQCPTKRNNNTPYRRCNRTSHKAQKLQAGWAGEQWLKKPIVSRSRGNLSKTRNQPKRRPTRLRHSQEYRRKICLLHERGREGDSKRKCLSLPLPCLNNLGSSSKMSKMRSGFSMPSQTPIAGLGTTRPCKNSFRVAQMTQEADQTEESLDHSHPTALAEGTGEEASVTKIVRAITAQSRGPKQLAD